MVTLGGTGGVELELDHKWNVFFILSPPLEHASMVDAYKFFTMLRSAACSRIMDG